MAIDDEAGDRISPVSNLTRFWGWLSDVLDLDVLGPMLTAAFVASLLLLWLAAVFGTAGWLFWLGSQGWRL